MAFMEFVVKIHSRCNPACDYCYVYDMADQSWRELLLVGYQGLDYFARTTRRC